MLCRMLQLYRHVMPLFIPSLTSLVWPLLNIFIFIICKCQASQKDIKKIDHTRSGSTQLSMALEIVKTIREEHSKNATIVKHRAPPEAAKEGEMSNK